MAAAQEQEEQRRRRETRRALVAYRSRLHRLYDRAEQLRTWSDFVRDLHSLLKAHEDGLAEPTRQRLAAALETGGDDRRGPQQALRRLDRELGRAIRELGGGSSLAPALLGVAFVALVGVGGAAGYLAAAAVPVLVRNEGCAPLAVSAGALDALPGVSLPEEPIPSGGQGTMTLPPLPVNVDATAPEAVTVGVLGATFPFPVGGGLTDVRLNGEPILGRRVDIALGSRGQHEVVVRCG